MLVPAPGDLINGKWYFWGLCSDAGGMGTLLFVDKTKPSAGKAPAYVLKYCKLIQPEALARFKREVRVMRGFKGNGFVMPVVDASLEHDPPYFVMPYCPDGDLATLAPQLRADLVAQEKAFNLMIDCIDQLHSQSVLHRDLKPQNFLRNGNSLLISDFGLCSDIDSETGLTRSSAFWGTPGYLPPEFLAVGGFRAATQASDVFMLGKTFYNVLSGRDPMYLQPDGIPGPVFAVIERACAIAPAGRFQSLSSLRQSLTAAYDVLLGRAVGPALAVRTLRAISDRLEAFNTFQPEEVQKFVEELERLDGSDKIQLCLELPSEIFPLLAQPQVQTHLAQFLAAYRRMAEDANYAWSFAEDIALNMRVIFSGEAVAAAQKAEALRIAIIAAQRQNRFAAMDTCRAMIASDLDDELAQRVHNVMLDEAHYFIENIEPSQCRAPAVRAALVILKAQEEDKPPF